MLGPLSCMTHQPTCAFFPFCFIQLGMLAAAITSSTDTHGKSSLR
jgi:hypothetical protein